MITVNYFSIMITIIKLPTFNKNIFNVNYYTTWWDAANPHQIPNFKTEVVRIVFPVLHEGHRWLLVLSSIIPSVIECFYLSFVRKIFKNGIYFFTEYNIQNFPQNYKTDFVRLFWTQMWLSCIFHMATLVIVDFDSICQTRCFEKFCFVLFILFLLCY